MKNLELSTMPLPEAVAALGLRDAEHDIVAGSRAVEWYTGRQALESARLENDAEHQADLDLIVSTSEYLFLRLRKDLGANVVRHSYPRPNGEGSYRVSSLNVLDHQADVWCQRWHEPARHPEGDISYQELMENSSWQSSLGARVLSVGYLVAQRQRSLDFLQVKPHLTNAEFGRLRKDQADLAALSTIKH